ncbi:MAG: GNAT family N-acetyltransferase [Bacteroidota bacterium]
MLKDNIQIKQVSIEEAFSFSLLIPEFKVSYPLSEYNKRLSGVRSLLLGAYIDNQAAGFKIGYEREDYFYSWMGGVVPQYRKMGVASQLAMHQEAWAHEQGFEAVVFKTRNHLTQMLLFALSNGFQIIDIQKKEQIADYRILLQKHLDR